MKNTTTHIEFEEYKIIVKDAFENHVGQGGFDVEDVEVGEIINFPINILLPDSESEWNDATTGGSFTEGVIDVEVKYGYFYINDGHNRVKTAIENGQTHIKAKIAYKK